jgi:hypothetical protein
MEFHPGKCYQMKVTHAKKPIDTQYTLNGHNLELVDKSTYLGVKLSADLKWNAHISSTCAKANSTLGLLRRNLRTKCVNIKDRAYRSLVRPKLEYGSTIWDYMGEYGGRTKGAGSKMLLDGVQRRAARYVSSDWDYGHSVTSMMEKLKWEPLEQRRTKTRLCMFYKVINGIVAIPWEDYLTPKKYGTRMGSESYYIVSSKQGCIPLLILCPHHL